jgi:hypothetical protein
MKSKIFCSLSFLSLVFLCQLSTYGQFTNGTPARPKPDSRRPTTTGSVTGGTQNIVNSKLLVYTRNGVGTTATNTGGEFPAQLVASATVNNEFSLQWSRVKPGSAQNCNLVIYSPNSTAVAFAKSVVMPAQSTAVNIGYSVPNLAPKT